MSCLKKYALAATPCLSIYDECIANQTASVPMATGCNPTPVPRELTYCERKKLQKEKDMQYGNISLNPNINIPQEAPFSAIETAQDHLTERLSSATEAKILAARKTFGMDNDDRPRTAQAFVDRVIAGKFYIPEDRKNAHAYDPTDWIQWRDPAIKKDEAGFEIAATAINAASDAVLDILIVKGPDVGLEAINAFKAKTIN